MDKTTNFVQRFLEAFRISSRIRHMPDEKIRDSYSKFWAVYAIEISFFIAVLAFFWATWDVVVGIAVCGITLIAVNPFISEIRNQYSCEIKKRKIKI